MNPLKVPDPKDFQQWFAAVVTTIILLAPVLIFAIGKDVPDVVWASVTFVIGVWLKPPNA